MLQWPEKHEWMFKYLARAVDAWVDCYFLFQSLFCVLLIVWMHQAGNFSGLLQIMAISVPFLLIGIVFFFIARFYICMISSKNQDAVFPGEFLFSLILSSAILFIVMIRTVFIAIVPSNEAKELYGREETVEGIVISFVLENSDNIIYDNDLLTGQETRKDESAIQEKENQQDTPARQSNPAKQKKLILIKTKYGLITLYCLADDFQYGDTIRANIRFLQPSPQRNPGGFDESAYYYSNGVYLKGSLINGAEPAVTRNAPFSISGIAYFTRAKIMRIFIRNIPPKEAGLMTGLFIGDRSGMSKDDILCYQKAGLSHITAVSGSAVTFLLIPLQALFKNMKIKKRKKSLLIFLVLFFFGFITGWTPSISRALIMVSILMMAKVFHKKIKIIQALWITVTIVLLAAPTFALNAGFWLSTIATAGIVKLSISLETILTRRNLASEVLAKTVSTSLAASVSVLPLAIWISKEISFSSILSSVLVLPLVEFTTILGSIEALTGMICENCFLTKILAFPLKGLLFLIYKIAFILSEIDILRMKAAGISFFSIIAIGGLVLFLFIKKKNKKRLCLVIAISVLTTGCIRSGIKTAMTPGMRIIFADVGQGDSTLILLKTGESILIDSGGKQRGMEIMSKMLDFYTIQYPSVYITTHTHEDHCGAMVRLIEERGGEALLVPYNTMALTVSTSDPAAKSETKNPATLSNSTTSTMSTGESDMGEELIAAAYKKNVKIKEVGRGDVIKINDQCEMTIYNPEKIINDSTSQVCSGNCTSLIIRITYENHAILITGDATGEIEQKLADSDENIAANIYRISHHGSPTSTNHDIISEVRPQVSIISVGTNFYGHPSPKVIERLTSAGSRIFRTDRNGAILLDINKENVQINAMIP